MRIVSHFLLFLLPYCAWTQGKNTPPPAPVSLGKDGRLVYTVDARGNRIPDFSYCGYRAGEQAIPDVAIQVRVPAKPGDATVRIQSAIDYVASLPIQANGFRGTVLLEKGTFEVDGVLKIRTSGIVIRGSGITATKLIGTGLSREEVIAVFGKKETPTQTAVSVSSPIVPVNALELEVSNASSFQPGNAVRIQRPCTVEWIKELGTDHFGGGVTALGWKAGQRVLYWDRIVTAVNGNRLTLDAPLTTALDAAYGQSTVTNYSNHQHISNIGIENLRIESSYSTKNPKDEDHRWGAISFEHTQDAWVRQVDFAHFAGSAVNIQETGRRITVEDCRSFEPVSEIGGERRYTFYTKGQQTLFQRLYSEYGYHDFAVGFCAAGPNAFVQCEAYLPYSFSGGVDSWASGVLFDIVNSDGNALRFGNLGQNGQGAGWNAANSVFWQCTAALVECSQPPTAQNWAFGTWAQFTGNGFWDQSNEHIRPRSLYYAQLKDRFNEEKRAILMPVPTEASSSPQVAVAMELTRQSVQPALTLSSFIADAGNRQSVSTQSQARTIDQIGVSKPAVGSSAAALQIKNGVLVRGETPIAGKRQEVPWWSGSARPYWVSQAKMHVTRFVPGKNGWGVTDNLEEVTDTMKARRIVALDHNYGLWYDRRRDDHERIRRMDGEVWPPFYELPFARSGKETAWDGLSKYDLTQYNQWYWMRLKQFADLADQKGLTLIHEQYFQHNIIEAGAHYADFPWRSANNINGTGFPEPVPYAGDKRIFMAEQFYDVSNPARRKVHRAYIRKSLENFVGNTGVIQLIGAEFTGPLAFVQFWLDTIGEWEKETGKNALVGLSTTKDVQDAILNDPKRAAIVDVIDIRFWHYQADGTAYSPEGGQNLAPRQQARLFKPKRSSFEQVYRAVSEYRQKFPAKAVTYAGDSFDAQGWAVFMGGGSMPNIPAVADEQFLKAARLMKPSELPGKPAGQYALSEPKAGTIIYTESAGEVKLPVGSKNYTVVRIDPKTGQIRNQTKGSGDTVSTSGTEILWIRF